MHILPTNTYCKLFMWTASFSPNTFIISMRTVDELQNVGCTIVHQKHRWCQKDNYIVPCNCMPFYPRPVMAFWYCHRLRLSVCLCVCVSVNHQFVRTITCHPLNLQSPKIGPEVQNTLVKIPVHWHWLSRSNWTLKVKIYPILGLWVSPCDKSIPNEVGFSKSGPEMYLSTVKVPIDFGFDWSWSSVSFLTSNLLYSTKFCVSYYLRRFVYI